MVSGGWDQPQREGEEYRHPNGAHSRQNGTVEVVWASNQDASWMSSIWGLTGHVQQGGDSGVDQELGGVGSTGVWKCGWEEGCLEALLGRLPPRSEPRRAEDNGWMDFFCASLKLDISLKARAWNCIGFLSCAASATAVTSHDPQLSLFKFSFQSELWAGNEELSVALHGNKWRRKWWVVVPWESLQCQKCKQHTTMTQMQLTTGFSIIHGLVESVYRGNKLSLVGCNWPNISLTLQMHSAPQHWMPNLSAPVHTHNDWGFLCVSLPLCSLFLFGSFSPFLSPSPSIHLNSGSDQWSSPRAQTFALKPVVRGTMVKQNPGCLLRSLPYFCIPQNKTCCIWNLAVRGKKTCLFYVLIFHGHIVWLSGEILKAGVGDPENS